MNAEPKHNCWVAVRIVRPAGDVALGEVYPTIQTCRGASSSVMQAGKGPRLADVVDASFLSTAKYPSYAFVSATDLIIFIVSPPNPAMRPVLRVRWGDYPSALAVVSGAVRGAAGRRAARLAPEDDGWGALHLDLEAEGMPSAPGHKGIWSAIEVHTDLLHERDRGLQQRIEHFQAGRIPPAPFWKTAGGYGAADPEVLQVQSQPAIAYQFSVRAAQRGGLIKLMGLEANNPLHDDHSGKGAHFHVALRGLKDVTPHLYMRSDGKLDASRTGTRGWELEVFGIFVSKDGALDIGPMVGLHHETSGMYLHVRRSKQEDRDPLVAWDDGKDGGSRWVVLHQTHREAATSSTL